MNKKIYYKINCTNLGDVLCSTPTIQKLSELYNTKLYIINDTPEVLQNNPFINEIINSKDFDIKNIQGDHEYLQSFVLPGVKNEFGIERKFNTIDLRQIHALDLGFSLMPEEMTCKFYASSFHNKYDLPNKYVVLHTAKNWPNRTWPKNNWQQIIDYLNKKNIFTVLIGKKTIEQEAHIINKDFYNFNNIYGLNLIDKTSLSDTWHIINNSRLFISFDTGPLHLAGTTNVDILHLGSAKDPRLVAPYRYGRQNYKYIYIKGGCSLYCTNNLKYSIKEWKTINAVPPLIGCLENKKSFECQPSTQQVIEYLDFCL